MSSYIPAALPTTQVSYLCLSQISVFQTFLQIRCQTYEMRNTNVNITELMCTKLSQLLYSSNLYKLNFQKMAYSGFTLTDVNHTQVFKRERVKNDYPKAMHPPPSIPASLSAMVLRTVTEINLALTNRFNRCCCFWSKTIQKWLHSKYIFL